MPKSDNMENDMEMFANISKVDEEKRMVFGYATTDRVDSQNEIVDRDATANALEEYKEWRNVREMHQPSAVGVAPVLELTQKGLWVGAKVIDDSAWEKVKTGVYKGFSIGGKRLEHKVDVVKGNEIPVTRITKYRLNEISLVDRPANFDAKFQMVKRDNSDEEIISKLSDALVVLNKGEINEESRKEKKEMLKGEVIMEEIKKDDAPKPEEKPPEVKPEEKPVEEKKEEPKVEEKVDKYDALKAQVDELKKSLDAKDAELKKLSSFGEDLVKRLEGLEPLKKVASEPVIAAEDVKKMEFKDIAAKVIFE